MNEPHSSSATRYLMSLSRHADKHNLGDTLFHISPPVAVGRVGEFMPWPLKADTRIAVLSRWLDTLTAPAIAVTTDADHQDVHLELAGTLDDGTPTVVVVVLRGAEANLLRANTTVHRDARVSVDLLRSLVSADAAEAVTVELALPGAAVSL